MGGVYARRNDWDAPSFEKLVLATLIFGVLMLLIKLALIVFRWRTNKYIH